MRIDTPQEAQYYANGGILQFVLRQLIASKPAAGAQCDSAFSTNASYASR